MLTLFALAAALAQPADPLPTLTPTADDTRITRSCRIVIPPGTVIPDANGNGVLHIAADHITVEFAPGSTLRGAPDSQAPDTFSGLGLTLDGHTGVTIKDAAISGYKVGLSASRAPGLTISGGDFSNNYHQRLRSTPKAEDGADWLFPHHNDEGQWLKNYGAALAVKDSSNITIRGVKVRCGQNGIVLDRVSQSRIFDNDCSFLSGWGIAMWRSSNNAITRNALDFCVRGYSHGVYNRGQDSAGLLMFEQNSNNLIAENSITHGGDGIFGFAGIEAIGEKEPPASGEGGKPWDPRRKGNNDNIIIANDLSYAPAHGLEMTFSHGNRILQNRMAFNAICGIWGGYSQDTLIAENTFESNGEMAYGLERGGINIEHGAGNLVLANTFKNNKCGVHLWWDNDGDLLKKPGVAAGYRGVTGNIIAANTFTGDALALHLRDDSPKKDKVRGTVFANNTLTNVKKESDLAPGLELITSAEPPLHMVPQYKVFGESRPVGARKSLAGRENIIMTEWGPWDHTGPMVRALKTSGAVHSYEFHNIDPTSVSVSGVNLQVEYAAPSPTAPRTARIRSASPGIQPYTITITDPAAKQELRGTLLSISWNLTVFPWEGPSGPNPPPDVGAWRAAAKSPTALSATVDALSFQFGMGGPSSVGISPEITAAKFKPDHFGLIATASLPLPKGKWRIKTMTDDGIRIIADGKTILENWTHHGGTVDTADLDLPEPRAVALTVEYFEIYGAAVLDVQIEPAP